MVSVMVFVLDPTEEELSKMKTLGEPLILSSDNPKDASLVELAQRDKAKVLMFVIENPNPIPGNTFGFGQSEDDFYGPFPNVDIFGEYWNRVKELDDSSVSTEIGEND